MQKGHWDDIDVGVAAVLGQIRLSSLTTSGILSPVRGNIVNVGRIETSKCTGSKGKGGESGKCEHGCG